MTPQEKFPIGSRWQSQSNSPSWRVRLLEHVASGQPTVLAFDEIRGSSTWFFVKDVATWTRLEDAPATPAAEPTPEERFPIGSRWKNRAGAQLTVTGHLTSNNAPRVVCRLDRRKRDYHYDPSVLDDFWTRLEDAAPERVQPAAVWRDTLDGSATIVEAINTAAATHRKPAPPREAGLRGLKCTHVIDEAAGLDWAIHTAPKPAPLCEAPGWLGREHDVDATEYGVCRVCGASESDRRAVRRMAFDASVSAGETSGGRECHEMGWIACVKAPRYESLWAPTRELAIEALWRRLEVGR